jgi:ADP-ribose pyrophosphatase
MKIIKKEKVFEGFFSLDEITIQNKEKTFTRLVLNRKKAVAGLLYNPVIKKFILVSQWRPGCESEIIEIFAGINETGVDDSMVLQRECLEELGYKIEKKELITQCYLSPGGSTEKVSIFLCTSSQKTEQGGGLIEEDEFIIPIEMSIDELLNYNFEDAKTIIAVDYVRKNKDRFM